MDRISGLPDDVLVKILSFVPTKVAVSTSIFSKRWQFLWMWLPKLEYEYVSRDPALRDFIDKYLPLHKAPVIESFKIYFNYCTKPEVVKRWVRIAVSRHVRELDITDFSEKCRTVFARSFYTSKSLVTLKLEQVTLNGVPFMACLPSLKTLELMYVDANDESFQELLSICPVLEELLVQFRRGDEEDVTRFTIAVPSLQSLSLFISDEWDLHGYKIDTPSLKYFKLEDWSEFQHYCKIKNMPKLVEARFDAQFEILRRVIGSITSVKLLIISSEILDTRGGLVFNQLETLKLECSNSMNHFYQRRDDDDALIIAKSMPELRQLQLIENRLTNTGLTAILDNCPHLKDLDLRECLNINLSDELEKRCLEMLKEIRLPKDSPTDWVVHDALPDFDSEDEEEEESESDDTDSEEVEDSEDDNSTDSDE